MKKTVLKNIAIFIFVIITLVIVVNYNKEAEFLLTSNENTQQNISTDIVQQSIIETISDEEKLEKTTLITEKSSMKPARGTIKPNEDNNDVNMVIEIEGDFYVKRNGNIKKLETGEAIYKGDVFMTGEESTATINIEETPITIGENSSIRVID